eukprot:122832-Pleurochrysis_carterae.AAC.1
MYATSRSMRVQRVSEIHKFRFMVSGSSGVFIEAGARGTLRARMGQLRECALRSWAAARCTTLCTCALRTWSSSSAYTTSFGCVTTRCWSARTGRPRGSRGT